MPTLVLLYVFGIVGREIWHGMHEVEDLRFWQMRFAKIQCRHIAISSSWHAVEEEMKWILVLFQLADEKHRGYKRSVLHCQSINWLNCCARDQSEFITVFVYWRLDVVKKNCDKKCLRSSMTHFHVNHSVMAFEWAHLFVIWLLRHSSCHKKIKRRNFALSKDIFPQFIRRAWHGIIWA